MIVKIDMAANQALDLINNGLAKASQAILNSEVVTNPSPNKILKLDLNSKLPASITGDSHTVDGSHAGNGPNDVLKLNSNALIPSSNIPLASPTTLGGIKLGSGMMITTDGTLNIPPSLQVAVLTGTISNGGIIPLPDGFTQGQCKWTISPSEYHDVDVGDKRHGFYCSVDGTRKVTAYMRNDEFGSTKGATANYFIIGIKTA